MTLSAAEKLMYTTVRLECELKDGNSSTGTGFFFSFKLGNDQHIPVIVTNKHVIENSDVGSFVLTKSDDQGRPLLGQVERVVLNDFENLWIKHPEKDVDLAVFAMAPLFREAEAKGVKFFSPPLQEEIIPNEQTLSDLSGLEDIIMIGYPNGIWDQKNNMPIIRKGVTATSPKNDYNELPIFVIDCACFPGSSGSPVLIFDQGGYMDARGNMNLGGNRIIFLGVLFAGPQHVAQGEIQTIDIPLKQVPISLSKIPNNLGFVIKSQKILNFKKLLV